ncbi:ROK family protein [Alicyclobacillus tolerans]|uniref:ROK family protein n=1 Tax=Alicyclobacillus tolerans TaxID=90970 RepID=UPI001F3B0E40|nr:ROK family protein [Alicyclobacillus tolerans]MCF8566672.1 ROK family protein [Alicyclobacillus tolerans]
MNNQPGSDNSFVLAFDFGGTKVALATADVKRKILYRSELPTSQFVDGPSVLRAAIAEGQQLVERTRQDTGLELAGVGVATMGITLPDRVEMAPNVPGWESLRIPAEMAGAFADKPVGIENDVKVAALAEVERGALQGVDFGMYVNFGTGIAMAYTLGQQVLRGHNGAAGEIAYCLRSKTESLGYADGAAPFEEFAGGKSIGQRASAHFGQTMSTRDLFELAATDEQAKKFVDETLQEIAFHITNAIVNWNPERVAFGGGMMAAKDVILPYLTRYVNKFVPFPPVMASAHFDRDAGLHGAVELAFRELTQQYVH